MLRHLPGKLLPNPPLTHLLAHPGVHLAQLAALPSLIPQTPQILRRLHRSPSRTRPHRQRLERVIRPPRINNTLPFQLTVAHERIPHLACVLPPLRRERRVRFVGFLLECCACARKVDLPALDVQIEQVEDDALGEVAKGAVIHRDALAGVDHLDPVQVALLHRLKVRDARVDAGEVVFDRVAWLPARVIW